MTQILHTLLAVRSDVPWALGRVIKLAGPNSNYEIRNTYIYIIFI